MRQRKFQRENTRWVNSGPGLCSYEDDSSKKAVFSFKNVFAINPLSHLDLLNTGKRQIFWEQNA